MKDFAGFGGNRSKFLAAIAQTIVYVEKNLFLYSGDPKKSLALKFTTKRKFAKN